MSAPESLIPLAGHWSGTSRLYLPWLPAPRDRSECASRAEVTRVVGGAFVSIAYTWEHEGRPHEGLLLLSHEPAHDALHAVWMDSWHMRERPLYCAGLVDGGGRAVVHGTYEAPPGPDWGWRTELASPDADAWTLRMTNISPEGEESLAFANDYRRDA